MTPMKPEPKQQDPDLAGTLSVEQIARRWHVTRKEVRQFLGHQKLRFVQVRGHFRVPIEEVERYEEARRQGDPAAAAGKPAR